MKKLFVFTLAIFAVLSFTSCDKDKDGKPLIVGEWITTKQEYTLAGGKFEDATPSNPCTLMFNEEGRFGVGKVVEESLAGWDLFSYWYETAGMSTGFYTGLGFYTTNGIYLKFKNLDEREIRECSYAVTSNILTLIYTPKGEVGTDDGVVSIKTTFKRK